MVVGTPLKCKIHNVIIIKKKFIYDGYDYYLHTAL
jgi:hypothetical protein